MTIHPIAYYKGALKTKFGIPRQSSIVEELSGRLIFEPEFSEDAFREIMGFERLWLIWEFSQVPENKYSQTVRPPRLGGNTRVGVFASRSPFRPNRLGLSCVKRGDLVRMGDGRIALTVFGADLMDGTPVFDVKPYLPYADAFPDVAAGYASSRPEVKYKVAWKCVEGDISKLGETERKELEELLSLDPRPAYHDAPDRVYVIEYAGKEVSFNVDSEFVNILSVKP